MTCAPGINQTVPGLFANIEHKENLDFIKKWLPLGEYFASKDTFDNEIFYLRKLDPYMNPQYLLNYYPANEDVYSKLFFDICQGNIYVNDKLETYGMDCSLLSSIVQYPWMVSFGEYNNQTLKWEHYCGGNIISKFVIVTTAHCFFYRGNRGKGFRFGTTIRVGDTNFTDTTDDVLTDTYEILTILKHPGYKGRGPEHDLALVFTAREIQFNLKVNSINLPSATNPIIDGNTNKSAKFSGWGRFSESLSDFSLLATNLTVFTGDYCMTEFNGRFRDDFVDAKLLCAGTGVSKTFHK